MSSAHERELLGVTAMDLAYRVRGSSSALCGSALAFMRRYDENKHDCASCEPRIDPKTRQGLDILEKYASSLQAGLGVCSTAVETRPPFLVLLIALSLCRCHAETAQGHPDGSLLDSAHVLDGETSDTMAIDGAPRDGTSGDVSPCVPTQPHALRACDGDEVHWFDDCGNEGASVKRCANGCSAGSCIARGWYGFGSSEIEPRTTTISWGSASGFGAGGPYFQASEPSLAVDPLGDPIVAFRYTGPPEHAAVRSWNGSRFTTTGSASLAAENVFLTSLAVGSGGQPMFAWSDASRVYFKRWDGHHWNELGGSVTQNPFGGDTGVAPVLAADPQGNPVIVWVARAAGSYSLRLRRWDGAAWSDLAGSGTSGAWTGPNADRLSASLAVDGMGNPYVAYCETSSGAHVRRWTGSAWAPMPGGGIGGAVGPQNGGCEKTTIALDTSGRPTVAYTSGGDLFVRRWNGTRWEVLAGSAPGNALVHGADDVSLALLGNGDPVVAWYESITTLLAVRLLRFDGTSWIELGGSASGLGPTRDPRQTFSPRLAVDASDRVLLAYGVNAEYPSLTMLLHLRRWDGVDWRELGPTHAHPSGLSDSGSGRPARRPTVALDSQRMPAVAYNVEGDGDTLEHAYLRRWSGAAWDEVGGSATRGVIGDPMSSSYDPHLAFDAQDDLMVAFGQTTVPNPETIEIYLKRWSGTAWMPLGASASGGGISDLMGRSRVDRLLVDSTGAPVILWETQDNTRFQSDAYLRRFDGTSWAELAGSGHGLPNAAGAAFADMGIDGKDAPIVEFWNDMRTRLVRFDGTAWQPHAGDGFVTDVRYYSMAVQSGTIALAWSDTLTPNNPEVYLKLWDGIAWRSLAGSDQGGGISNNPGRSNPPAVALDERGFPIVVWNDNSGGAYNIYARRWDGIRWEEIQPASATRGGVSNSETDAECPAVAYRDHRLCAAWDALTAYANSVLMRCIDFEP